MAIAGSDDTLINLRDVQDLSCAPRGASPCISFPEITISSRSGNSEIIQLIDENLDELLPTKVTPAVPASESNAAAE